MDKVERYRQLIMEVLLPLAKRRYANADVANEAVFDCEHDHYLVISMGQENKTHRIYYCLVHVDIINDKGWIQRDGTEDGIGFELEKAGIARADIVPAFHPESVRPHTGYAVA